MGRCCSADTPVSPQLPVCPPPGAIGNAEWAGVRLRDVLEYAGFDERTASEVTHAGHEIRLSGQSALAAVAPDRLPGRVCKSSMLWPTADTRYCHVLPALPAPLPHCTPHEVEPVHFVKLLPAGLAQAHLADT